MSSIDLSEIIPHMIRPNQVLQLIFPEKGFIHLRVLSADDVPFLYGSLPTIQPGDTDVSTANRLGISSLDIENAIEVNKDSHLYQLFYGISPGIIRSRIGYPMESMMKSLDVRSNQVAGDFGYLDGYRSPLNKPSPLSELMIPPDFDIGWVFHNPDTIPIKPMLYWHIVTMRVHVIRNSQLIYNILAGKVKDGYIQKKHMGGLLPYHFYSKEMWGIDMIGYHIADLVDIAESSNDMGLRAVAMKEINDALGTPDRSEGPSKMETAPIY